MNNNFIDIAGVIIKIKNNNPVANEIINDLGDGQIYDNKYYDISLEIFDSELKNYQATVFSAKGSMNFNSNEYFVDYLVGANYIIKNLFNDDATTIKVNCGKSSLRARIKQFIVSKTLVKKNIILSYSLFWYAFHMALLQKEKSFLHSGIVDVDGCATIIAGTGGCGKTSTLFKILENDNAKYVAEDFGIIDKEGFTYYNPKPVSVYASDMEFGQCLLKDYIKKFTTKEKTIWSLKRRLLNINPIVKVIPSKLMDNRITRKSKIKNVLYLIRNNDKVITMQDIDVCELVERSLNSSMRELKTLNELLLLIKSNAPTEYCVPSFGDIRLKSKNIYLKAFENTNNKVIYIPHKTRPVELVEYLTKNGLV